VIYPIVSNIAFDYEFKYRKDEDADSRIVAFNKEIEILKKIDSNLAKRGEIEHSEILKINPILKA
jgi:pyruvate/2-oxoacid:ferredoxin oxidoreductase alpha subunit